MSDLYHFTGGYQMSPGQGQPRRQDGGAVSLSKVQYVKKGPWSDSWQDWSVILVLEGNTTIDLELVHYEDFLTVWEEWLDRKNPTLDVKP